jgi:hypothetical protein
MGALVVAWLGKNKHMERSLVALYFLIDLKDIGREA